MKKIANVLLNAIVSSVVIYLMVNVLNYMLLDDYDRYTRVTFHELFENDENVDVLFLGSSHCMHSMNAKRASSNLGIRVFNAGTAAQYNDASYQILDAAVKKHEIDKVFVEIFHGQIGQTPESRGNITATYIVADYLPLSIEKVKYLLDASSEKQLINSFFPARRNWSDLFSPEKIVARCINKNTNRYKNYEYFGAYKGDGYVTSKVVVKENTYGHLGRFAQVREMSDYDKKYLGKIIDLCQKEGIELYFYSAPMSDFRVMSLGNYDDYVVHIKEYLSEYGIPYWDFNLCKETICAFNEEDFFDDNHLNTNGADKFTDLWVKLVDGSLAVEELFYDSYAEKIAAIDKNLHGIMLNPNVERNAYTINPIWKYEEDITFTVYKIVGGNRTLVMENDASRIMPVESGETGSFEISVYKGEEQIWFTTINF